MDQESCGWMMDSDLPAGEAAHQGHWRLWGNPSRTPPRHGMPG
eukprot:CAMPEP_0181211774 /NCGR_PEP_ID=MMETSP1096-20121128/23979_1 /TAXON_ID=156174 ORGANISM="Chrysochromulina ericina, Strain CCMP281" /NCGR_SAMPLE_ID=MMETSP1096 /ASSEMBLY_ACC=CAM_ASM_000453 /LENGTH=42 /DNA_ID= /DNA_START= /DNA_END= /DNA_ORIENTATION=